jgi:HEAT repeat protein
MPPAAEFANLRRAATDGPERLAAINRLIGIGIPALDALAAVPEGEQAFVAVASRMGSAAAPSVAKLAVSPDARLARLALLTAGHVPIPNEALVAALGRPELQSVAAEAAGRAKAAAAVPILMTQSASSDPSVVRTAVETLAAIGDPQAASTAAVLIENPDFRIRRAAQKILIGNPAIGVSTGRRLVTTGEPYRQRIGLELLGKIGTPDALAAVAPLLQTGGRDTKIGALLALNGHVPTEMIAAVEALRRDPDPLVRSVAERVDVGG